MEDGGEFEIDESFDLGEGLADERGPVGSHEDWFAAGLRGDPPPVVIGEGRKQTPIAEADMDRVVAWASGAWQRQANQLQALRRARPPRPDPVGRFKLDE